MQTVTIAQIAERLEELPIDKLLVVYDFVLYLAERGNDLPHAEIAPPKDTRTQYESHMKQKLTAAAEVMREDYLTDDELTSFTALDGEDFRG